MHSVEHTGIRAAAASRLDTRAGTVVGVSGGRRSDLVTVTASLAFDGGGMHSAVQASVLAAAASRFDTRVRAAGGRSGGGCSGFIAAPGCLATEEGGASGGGAGDGSVSHKVVAATATPGAVAVRG